MLCKGLFSKSHLKWRYVKISFLIFLKVPVYFVAGFALKSTMSVLRLTNSAAKAGVKYDDEIIMVSS